MIVTIAGMHLALSSRSSAVVAEIESSCAFFSAGQPHDEQPGLRIVCSSREFESSFPVSLHADTRYYKADTPEFSTAVDVSSGRGSIRYASGSPGSFSRALKNLAYYLVLAQGGVVLHAAGVVKDQEAYIFFGPSGSGKSTVCRLSGGCAILSQECLGILKNAVWALPYADDAEFELRVPSCNRIAVCTTLVQDTRVFSRKLSKREALTQMLPAPHDNFQALCSADRMLDVMSAMLDGTPCYELHFRQDSSFWECMTADATASAPKGPEQ
jgi:hypothetical protein